MIQKSFLTIFDQVKPSDNEDTPFPCPIGLLKRGSCRTGLWEGVGLLFGVQGYSGGAILLSGMGGDRSSC